MLNNEQGDFLSDPNNFLVNDDMLVFGNSFDRNPNHVLDFTSQFNVHGCLDINNNDFILPKYGTQQSSVSRCYESSFIDELEVDEDGLSKTLILDGLVNPPFTNSIDTTTGTDDMNASVLTQEDGCGITHVPSSTNGSGRRRNNSKLRTLDSKNSDSSDNGTWVRVSSDLVPRAEYCPDALVNYLLSPEGKVSQNTIEQVLMHLSLLGWKFECKNTDRSTKLRYISPNGKIKYSLVDICKNLTRTTDQSSQISGHNLDGNLTHGESICGGSSSLSSEAQVVGHNRKQKSKKDLVSVVDEISQLLPEYCPQAVMDWYNYGGKRKKLKTDSESGCTRTMTLKVKKHLLSVGWKFSHVIKQKHRRELRYISPKGKTYISLVRACQGYLEDEELLVIGAKSKLPPNRQKFSSLVSRQPKKSSLEKKKPRETKSFNKGDWSDEGYQLGPLRPSKSARQITIGSSVDNTRLTVLSWLVDSNIVSPKTKVYCTNRNENFRTTTGIISRDGILCNCCHKYFSLPKFEAHAGNTSTRPSASIFLEDARSLWQCQMQTMEVEKINGFNSEPLERIKRNSTPPEKNNYICSLCHIGGNLLQCVQCPSSFHLSCLGLKDMQEENWFCPSCRCGICEEGEFNGDIKKFTEKTVLCCDQCERQYHVGCIRQRELVKLESCPTGKWFCSITCEKIFEGLHKVLGKSLPVGVFNLTWTLLKFSSNDYNIDIETMAEHYSKLNVARCLIDECFEPMKQSYTKRDLVKDVLFNRRSEADGQNFHGFYTLVLQRDDELISVAIMRVFGHNVAEVPLICTRVQYRLHGMCRILMDVVQKALVELGVEKLTMPTTLEMLLPWTKTFSFSMMTNHDRLKLLEYRFLDFQNTKMCQKILRTSPAENAVRIKR